MSLQQYRKACRPRRTVIRSRDRGGSRDENHRRIHREGRTGGSGWNGHAGRHGGRPCVAAGKQDLGASCGRRSVEGGKGGGRGGGRIIKKQSQRKRREG